MTARLTGHIVVDLFVFRYSKDEIRGQILSEMSRCRRNTL